MSLLDDALHALIFIVVVVLTTWAVVDGNDSYPLLSAADIVSADPTQNQS